MASGEQHAHYYPAGVPITPQASRFGYGFPVYVSNTVWRELCIATDIPQKHGANIDERIIRLLTACYEGMIKELAKHDDFVFYDFKHWYWKRGKPKAKKMAQARLGARLFMDPETNAPWMYIFLMYVDSIDTLKSGDAPEAEV